MSPKPLAKWRIWPEWVGEVTPATLRADLFAGFTSATVVLPQAVAFAAIAGLPPQYGLYTAIVTPIVAALFGSSRVMVSGPTLVISAVVFGTLSAGWQPLTPSFVAAALALTAMVGLFQIAFGLMHLGRLVNFVSHSVMLGFTASAALLIIASQLKDALGVPASRGATIVETISNVLGTIASTNPYAIAISMTTLAVLVGVKTFAPALPAFILALVAGLMVAWGVNSEAHGVRMVGTLPSLVPSFSLPQVSLEAVRELAEGAFAIALLGLLEAVSIGRAFSIKTGRRFDANKEIVAQGLSNAVGSLFQCYAGSGSFTRSGVNYEAGARTPLSAIFSSLLLVLILIVVAPVFAQLPVPAIAGVILYVAFRLIDFGAIRRIVKTSGTETVIVTLTCLAGLLVSLEFAIYSGVITSLLIFLSRTAKPTLAIGAPDARSSRRPFRNADLHGLPECPQAVFARLDGPLYFGSVDYLDREFERLRRERPGQAHLVLILRGVGEIDLPGGELLIEEANQRRAVGGDMILVARYPPLRSALMRFHVFDFLGIRNVVESKSDGIETLVPRLDPEICRRCQTRIFEECPDASGRARDDDSVKPGGFALTIARDAECEAPETDLVRGSRCPSNQT